MAKAIRRDSKPERTAIVYTHCVDVLSAMRFGKGSNTTRLSDADIKKTARQISRAFGHFLGDKALTRESEVYQFQRKYDAFIAGLEKRGLNFSPEKIVRIAVLAPNLITGDPETTLGNLFGTRDKKTGLRIKGLIERIRDNGITLTNEDLERILVRAPQWAYLSPDTVIAKLFGGKDRDGHTHIGVFPALETQFGKTKLTERQKHDMLVRNPQLAYQTGMITNLFGKRNAKGRRTRLGLYDKLAALGANLSPQEKVKLLADFPQLGSQRPESSINRFLLKRHLKFISGVRARAQAPVNGQDMTNGVGYYLFGIVACELMGNTSNTIGSVNTYEGTRNGILRSFGYLTRAGLDAAVAKHLGLDAKTAKRIRNAAANDNREDSVKSRYALSNRQRNRLLDGFVRAERQICEYSRANIQHQLRHGEDAIYGEDRPHAAKIIFGARLVNLAQSGEDSAAAQKAREELYYRMHIMMNTRRQTALNNG
ncbi:MAG: hypothetical protein SFW65_08080 [Alphaproteobacteria bacterium]|nr:hypothetical protein [Alphaproteobacteria bacterium]